MKVFTFPIHHLWCIAPSSNVSIYIYVRLRNRLRTQAEERKPLSHNKFLMKVFTLEKAPTKKIMKI